MRRLLLELLLTNRDKADSLLVIGPGEAGMQEGSNSGMRGSSLIMSDSMIADQQFVPSILRILEPGFHLWQHSVLCLYRF